MIFCHEGLFEDYIQEDKAEACHVAYDFPIQKLLHGYAFVFPDVFE
jgi:hypothetical protein